MQLVSVQCPVAGHSARGADWTLATDQLPVPSAQCTDARRRAPHLDRRARSPAPRKTLLVYIWLHHKVGTRPDFGRVSRGASAASGRPTSHAGGPADPVGTRPVVRWARGGPRSPLSPDGIRYIAATRAARPPTDECAECGHPHLSRLRRRRTSAWTDQSSTLRHLQAAWQGACI